MDDSFKLPAWLRQTLIGLGLFLLGGLLSFGYSYRPLHGALTWQVEQLEARLDERNLENLRLADEVAKLRSSEAERVDPDSFAQVERELAKTRSTLAQAEKDLSRADRKRKDANASASRWRKRYEKLRDEQSLAAKAAAAATSDAGAAPAAPAPASGAAPATPPSPASTAPGEAGTLAGDDGSRPAP